MKKILLLLSLFVIMSHSKSMAQAATNIAVSISGIDYDDPSFASLKDAIQKNSKAKNISSNYKSNTAYINLSYSGKAQDLWDALPQSAKQSFKVTGIDNSSLQLQSRTATTQTTSIKTNTTTSSTSTDDFCKNCYYPICKYDGTKSFQGAIFRQVNKDDGTYYYNCDNGIVVIKQVFVNSNGVTTNITNDTLLISSGPVGTKWGVKDDNTSFLGMESKSASSNTLIAKGVKVTVNGVTYNDVIVVNSHFFAYNNLMGGGGSTSYNCYYARGVGRIKMDTLKDGQDMMEGLVANKVKGVKGTVDPELAGLWKYQKDNTLVYWKLNVDGTYDYYSGAMTEANKQKMRCYWWMDKDVLVTHCEGDIYKGQRYELLKQHDSAGKPTLVINGYVYVSADNHAAWK